MSKCNQGQKLLRTFISTKQKRIVCPTSLLVKVGKGKSAAERMREYRARKELLSKCLDERMHRESPKTPAERMRYYRARKDVRSQRIEECVVKVKRKTPAERMREYRARKKKRLNKLLLEHMEKLEAAENLDAPVSDRSVRSESSFTELCSNLPIKKEVFRFIEANQFTCTSKYVHFDINNYANKVPLKIRPNPQDNIECGDDYMNMETELNKGLHFQVDQDVDTTEQTRIERKRRPGGGHTCCVPQCTSSTNRTGTKYSFFSMPKNNDRIEDWLRAICRMDLIPIARESKINYYVVCGKHFETSMFLNDLENRLQSTAIPTLYLPEKGDISIMPESLGTDGVDSDNTSSSDAYNNLTGLELASIKDELVDEEVTNESTEPTAFHFNINQQGSFQESMKTNQNHIEMIENCLNIKTEIEEPQVEEELPSALPTMSFEQKLVMVNQFAQNHFNPKLAKLVRIQCDLLKLEAH